MRSVAVTSLAVTMEMAKGGPEQQCLQGLRSAEGQVSPTATDEGGPCPLPGAVPQCPPPRGKAGPQHPLAPQPTPPKGIPQGQPHTKAEGHFARPDATGEGHWFGRCSQSKQTPPAQKWTNAVLLPTAAELGQPGIALGTQQLGRGQGPSLGFSFHLHFSCYS